MPDRRWERRLRDAGHARVAGVDEAGRGPLAGPVVAAAVVLHTGATPRTPRGIDDSKRLDPAVRAHLVRRIVLGGVADFGVGVASVEEIERLNILQASLLAMRRALADLGAPPDHVLVDGNQRIPGCEVAQTPCVGGDARHTCIAAASILAKETRDNLMRGAALAHPQYGFDAHKGYATAAHVAALRTHGPCALHRRAFLSRIIAVEVAQLPLPGV
jgi:ribonuclease HII